MSSLVDVSSRTGLRALVGTVIHSIGFGELQVLPRGAIFVNSRGTIQKVLDMSGYDSSAVFAPDTTPFEGVEEVRDFGRKLIIPGFIDAHCHAPQYAFTGTGMDLPLLQWLEKYTFPTESRFSDLEFARAVYSKSVRRHLRNGTTFACYFATIHNSAAKVLVDVIAEAGQRAYVGKVSMDRNSPDFYIEETNKGLEDAEEFVRLGLKG